MPKTLCELSIIFFLHSLDELGNVIDLYKYFEFEAGTDVSGYKFYIGSDEVDAEMDSANEYYLTVSSFGILDFDKPVTFKVSDGTNAFEVKYSILSYIYRVLESDKASEEMVDLAQAMYIAYVATVDYYA